MLKGFFVGALVGFVFGSSKQGMQARQKIDGMLNNLLSTEHEVEGALREAGERVVDLASKGASRVSGGQDNGRGGNRNSGNGNGRAEDTGKRQGHSSAHEMDSGERKLKRGTAEQADKNEGGSKSPESNDTTGEAGVPMDQAVQLAQALNAKPSAPHSDELEPS